ncbi:UNVERIFIED_CONTAM: hypothetical protein RMT77_018739 [Armadillidium vulgare]
MEQSSQEDPQDPPPEQDAQDRQFQGLQLERQVQQLEQENIELERQNQQLGRRSSQEGQVPQMEQERLLLQPQSAQRERPVPQMEHEVLQIRLRAAHLRRRALQMNRLISSQEGVGESQGDEQQILSPLAEVPQLESLVIFPSLVHEGQSPDHTIQLNNPVHSVEPGGSQLESTVQPSERRAELMVHQVQPLEIQIIPSPDEQVQPLEIQTPPPNERVEHLQIHIEEQQGQVNEVVPLVLGGPPPHEVSPHDHEVPDHVQQVLQAQVQILQEQRQIIGIQRQRQSQEREVPQFESQDISPDSDRPLSENEQPQLDLQDQSPENIQPSVHEVLQLQNLVASPEHETSSPEHENPQPEYQDSPPEDEVSFLQLQREGSSSTIPQRESFTHQQLLGEASSSGLQESSSLQLRSESSSQRPGILSSQSQCERLSREVLSSLEPQDETSPEESHEENSP